MGGIATVGAISVGKKTLQAWLSTDMEKVKSLPPGDYFVMDNGKIKVVQNLGPTNLFGSNSWVRQIIGSNKSLSAYLGGYQFRFRHGG